MNIELRWVERRLNPGRCGTAGPGPLYERVLQYRTYIKESWIAPDGLSGMSQTGWSDWRDVPVVKEE